MLLFVFVDAALVLLWTTSFGCLRLRTPQARVHMDVRLDCVLRRSRDPGNTTETNINNRNRLWIHSFGHSCCILKWAALTAYCVALSRCDNYCLWLIKVFIGSLGSLQRGLTRVTAIKLLVVSSHPANNYLDHVYPLKHIFCDQQTSSAFSHINLTERLEQWSMRKHLIKAFFHCS